MPFLFPFEGCHVEVLSTLGVRYQGVLKKVDGENRCITLTNVHHFGSETRVVKGVAPIPAKGALPADEERLIYAVFVDGIRGIPPLPSPPPPSPPPPTANSAAHQPPTVTVPSGEVMFVHNQHPAPREDGPGAQAAANNLPYSSSLAQHLSTYFNEESKQRVNDAVMTRQEELVARVDDGLEEGRRKRRAAEGQRLSTAAAEEGPRMRRKKKKKGDKRKSSENNTVEPPTYFLGQYHRDHNTYFTGILTNAPRHPSAPVYVGFDVARLTRIATPRIGQLWEAPNWEWNRCGRRFVNEHYVRGRDPKGIQHFIDTHGMPWINDQHINLQAMAKLNGLRLVADVEVERRWGRVANSWVDLIGKRYITVANLRHGIDGVEIETVAANGSSTSESARFECSEGEEVEVKMVRLPVGCWVGPRFVLPSLDDDNGYRDDKPPFRPDAISHGLEFVKRSGRGDYFPVGVRPASAKPVYFIAQRLLDIAIGILLKRHQHPRAPLFVGIHCANPIHGEVVRLGQKWLLPPPNNVDYSFICNANPKRSIMPRINEKGMLGMDAKLDSREGIELVKSPKLKVRQGKIKYHWRSTNHDTRGAKREDVYVEVAARGAISGVQLNQRRFDGLFADFLELAEGDRVEVEMVRLEEGCWVGPNYLLPDIYGGADHQSELRKMRAVRARSGDYMPVGIREPEPETVVNGIP